MNRFDIVVGAIACEMSHNLSSCDPPETSFFFVITFDNFVGWAAHQTVFCGLYFIF